jgi:CubicO group peptidase (beta-lactamase class C family)
MKTATKRILYGLLVVALVLAGCGGFLAWKSARIGTAYAAKVLCSAVFISGRDPEAVRAEELGKYPIIDTEIDMGEKSVTASVLGLADRTAVYREGLGATLVIGTSRERILAQKLPPEEVAPAKGPTVKEPAKGPQPRAKAARVRELPWPRGDRLPKGTFPPGVDRQKLEAALDGAFSEPDPRRLRRTRAVVVVYDGHLVAERYAPGFSKETALIGWSMTKSVTNALIGILVGRGKLSVEAPAPVPEWQKPGDPRREITLDHLLRMSSGLEFGERYDSPFSDVARMLFGCSDAAAYAIGKPLEARPGSRWKYSSGTTNIIARIMRRAVEETDADFLAFPRRALFDRIGMGSAVMEPDASGTFVGSSFMYATARDWARFGLLYLQDGVWYGKRILPEGWVAYACKPAPAAPLGQYGAHFWLNAGSPNDRTKRWMPGLPVDMFAARGYEGQCIMVIPSRKLVAVRLGLTRARGAWDQESFVVEVLKALPRGDKRQ